VDLLITAGAVVVAIPAPAPALVLEALWRVAGGGAEPGIDRPPTPPAGSSTSRTP
jgi:hypothetical protein